MLHVRAFTVICGTRVTSSRSRILLKTKPEARMLNGWMSTEKKASYLCQRLLAKCTKNDWTGSTPSIILRSKSNNNNNDNNSKFHVIVAYLEMVFNKLLLHQHSYS